MLSEFLSSLCHVTSFILQEQDYILARVEVKGSAYIAEAAARVDDPTSSRIWPPAAGTMRPALDRKESGRRLLLYKDTGGRLLTEKLGAGALSEDEAKSVTAALAGTLRNLHTRGFFMGYIGPENVYLQPDGTPLILAGARGIPSSPFSAPEVLSSAPVDPRSDIFALGTLMFRLVSGSDDREMQLEAWQKLSTQFTDLMERMVDENPSRRHANLASLIQDLTRSSQPAPPAFRSPARRKAPAPVETVEQRGTERRGTRRRWLPIAAVAGLGLVAALFVLFTPSPGTPSDQGSAVDSLPAPPGDSLPSEDPSLAPDSEDGTPFADPSQTIVWISNCSGISGAASDFRTGPARDFPVVYPSTGSGTRRSTVFLLRRDDFSLPLTSQFHWRSAVALLASDSTLSATPVDMTILLGRDLSYPGLDRGALSADTTAPAETVFVDVVNQGLQYTLEGSGPATWVAEALEGRRVSLAETRYIIHVVDVRDGDRIPNEETGLPAVLDSTVFLYRSDEGALPEMEGVLRSYFQAIPDEISGPPQGVPIPDIWVVLGHQEGDSE